MPDIAKANLPPASNRLAFPNITIGSVAYGSLGTNTTDVNGQLWITDVWVPGPKAITKIGVLQGGTATTDNIMVMLYDVNGILLGNSATAGSLLSGASTFKELSLLATVQVYGGQYFVAVQGNGTAAGAIRTVATNTFTDVLSTTAAGTFGTVPATITVPTTFTADLAPIVYLK
jgi:hypothetical protein